MQRMDLWKILSFSVFLMLSFLVGCVPQTGEAYYNYSNTTYTQEGRIVVTITDAAANLNSLFNIFVTIDSVQVHSREGGWVSLSSRQRTFDLLQLRTEGSSAILADTRIDAGSYDQIRLDISKVVVVDNRGSREAKLPSSDLKIFRDIVVNPDSTSTVAFDFLADESLHMTANREYILAPVLRMETRENSQVEFTGNQRVIVRGGNVHTNVKVGMSVEGSVGEGMGISERANVSITNGKIVVNGQPAVRNNHVNAKAGAGVNVGTSGSSTGSSGSGSSGGGY